MKHAPTADIYEQMVLILMADSADEDGCNAYRSKRRIAELAKDIDERTVVRKWRTLEARGLIRRDTTPAPDRYLRIPKNRRPVRWEVCIPYAWWSDSQREDIQRGREDRDLEPITPESRPDIATAPPPKTARSDKGKSNPKRSRKRKSATADDQAENTWGVSETPQESDPRGVSQSPPGVSLSHPQGCLSVTQPSPSTAPGVPSSPPAPPDSESSSHSGDGPGREDENATAEEPAATPLVSGDLSRAESLVADAVRRWASGHRAPGARDRHRLAERVTAELDAGGDERVILDELTRDLGDARSAVSVVLGARTATPGWGRSSDPRPDATRYEPTGPKPAWCGVCDERTRLVAALAVDGSERMRRCQCHPQEPSESPVGGTPAGVEDAPAPTDSADAQDDSDGVDEQMLDRMRASLTGSESTEDRGDSGGLTPAARAAADGVRQLLGQQ